MPEIPALFTRWDFWYLMGAAVVLVAALLLIGILVVARSIEKEAERVLAAARRIQANTAPIPRLVDTLDALMGVHDRVEAIAEKTELLAGILHGETGEARTEEWER